MLPIIVALMALMLSAPYTPSAERQRAIDATTARYHACREGRGR